MKVIYFDVWLGDNRVSSIESISSSNDRTMGSSTQRPLRNRQGPVTLTSWAQSPTVDEVMTAVTVDVLVMVDRVTNGCFFFRKTWSGNLLNSRSSSSVVPLKMSVSPPSIDPSYSAAAACSSSITNMSSDDLPDRCSAGISPLLITALLLLLDLDLDLPQIQTEGSIHIIRITIEKRIDFIFFQIASAVMYIIRTGETFVNSNLIALPPLVI